MKFDFLGLRTLTIIDWAVKAINMRHERAGIPPLDITALPLDDEATYKTLRERRYRRGVPVRILGHARPAEDARPDRFEDIIALVSLFRPGPMDLIPSVNARKHGQEEIIYPDPRTEAILKTPTASSCTRNR